MRVGFARATLQTLAEGSPEGALRFDRGLAEGLSVLKYQQWRYNSLTASAGRSRE